MSDKRDKEKAPSSALILVIEVLSVIVILGEISAAVAQCLHMTESSAILHLADTALGGLIGFLVSPVVGGRVAPALHKNLAGHRVMRQGAASDKPARGGTNTAANSNA